MTSQDNDLLIKTQNNAGIITFNRPKYLNALTKPMITTVLSQLREWERNKSIVIIKSSVENVFSSGGNLKSPLDLEVGSKFTYVSYNIDYTLAKYKIPCVALVDGIAMGGALGLAVQCRYRVATEKTLVAMPETKIGFFPDASATYYMPRMRDNLGIYLGLTGEKLVGKDAVIAGFATHFVHRSRLHELENLLIHCQNDTEVKSLLNKYSETLGELSLAPHMKHIKYCFAASTVEEIIARLHEVNNEWSVKTLKTLHRMCPGSLKITLRAFQRGVHLDLGQCLQMEFRIACHFALHHDLREGIRALIVDKDNNPQWMHKSLAEVDDEYVERFFKRLPEHMELKFIDSKL